MNPGLRCLRPTGLSLLGLPFSEARPEPVATAWVGGAFLHSTSDFWSAEQLKSFIALSDQPWLSSCLQTAVVLGTSECLLLDPDFLGPDVHAFPHFS